MRYVHVWKWNVVLFCSHKTSYIDQFQKGVEEFMKLVEFLGVDIDEELKHAIIENSGFDKMKRDKSIDYIDTSFFQNGYSFFRKGLEMVYFLSYHRCFIWFKSAFRVYYSYLRQAIHDRVTSEVNISKMQMTAIFSIDSKVWLMNDDVWQHKCL